MCGDNTKLLLGFAAQTLDGMPKDWRNTMREKYRITNHLSVIRVNENSPADEAGLKIGGKLIRIGDEELGEGKRATSKFDKVVKKSGTAPINPTVLRNNVEIDVIVTPVTVCSYPVEMIAGDTVNAFADGYRVVLTTGMRRFAETDEELALIVGHGLAHNTRNHIEAKRGNQLLGGLIGALATGLTGVDMTQLGMDAGALAYSQEFEEEADPNVAKSIEKGFARPTNTRLFGPIGTCASSSQRVTMTHMPDGRLSRRCAYREGLCIRRTNR